MTDDETKNKPPSDLKYHDKNGRFAPGNPGGGRKKGSRNRTYSALDAVAEAGAKAVLETVMAKASEGDMQAARILMDRVWRPRAGRPVEVTLPPVETAAGVVGAYVALLEAVAAGDLTAEEAQPIAGLLEAHRKALETAEIVERIEALEQAQGPGGRP